MSMIGKTLGNFECAALLGKGGMGEVYQATDQKLGRDVAIKVLPEEFAEDADRVARFQREAKLLASLNHPNIAAIYGLEESNGTHFLVMELIKGDTLADRLKRGPIPVEESLKLGLQIAEALEAAHEKGVIHRDLKPANIKVTPDGKIKVLDFGLAKAFAGEQAEVNLSHSPTLSEAATLQGVILGTAAYMSPEQARGKPVDKHTDIWAFGCVLYEMLTGKAAFQGEDVTEILAAVVKSGVNLDLLPANIHSRVREVLSRCLQKEQKKRYRDIGEAQYEIAQVLAEPSGVFVQPASTVKPRKKMRVALPWVAAAIVLTAIIAGAAVWMLRPIEPKRVMRFDYHLPQNQEFSVADNLSVVGLSPDGSKFVYSTTDGLYLRSLDAMDARFIPGTDGNSMQPFFSPDGQWIGYLSGTDQKLKKVAISGGPAVTLCDAAGDGGFSWSPDDRILHATGENIMWVSSNGGKWESLIRQEGGLLGFPQILPDGESVMYLNAATAPYKIMVQSLKSGQQKELLEANIAQYVKTGHIVYGRENNLYAVQFDMDALEVIGGSVPLVEGVLNVTYYWHYAISDSGTLVYVTEDSPGFGQRTFVWVDREGNEQPLGAEPNGYDIYFKISPDGMKVALSIMESGNMDIWIWDQERKNSNRLTFNGAFDVRPIWTPDSKRIIFDSGREGREGIFLIEADGSGKVERVARISDRMFWPSSISADGKILFLVENAGDEGRDNVGMLSLEGDRTPKLLLQEEYSETTPRISPDGRWMAYASDESGRWRIYVRPFPDIDSGGRRQVSTSEGGDSPVWSPDGRELFYRSENSIMAVPVETEPTLKLGTPVSLFPNRYYVGGFDIHPDGDRFLMLKPVEVIDGESTEDTTPKINVVVNWFEELKERVPVD